MVLDGGLRTGYLVRMNQARWDTCAPHGWIQDPCNCSARPVACFFLAILILFQLHSLQFICSFKSFLSLKSMTCPKDCSKSRHSLEVGQSLCLWNAPHYLRSTDENASHLSVDTTWGTYMCCLIFLNRLSFNPTSWKEGFHSRGFPRYLCPGLTGQRNQRRSYFVGCFIVQVSRKQTVFHTSCNPFAERPCRDYGSKQAHHFAQISRRAAAIVISS